MVVPLVSPQDYVATTSWCTAPWYCTLVLQYCTLVLQYCTLVLQNCTLVLQYCTLVLHNVCVRGTMTAGVAGALVMRQAVLP